LAPKHLKAVVGKIAAHDINRNSPVRKEDFQ